MTGWIVLVVVAIVVALLWKGMRTMWTESRAKVDALAPANVRRTWPLPRGAGERVMWCPILAKKLILADTHVDEGEVGTVVGFTDDRHHPIIAFDDRTDDAPTVDKWGAARVLPVELDRPRRKAPPRRRTNAKKGRTAR